MNPLILSGLVGVSIFIAIYANFDAFYEKILASFVRVHEETLKVSESLFIRKDSKQVLRDELMAGGVVAALFFMMMLSSPALAMLFAVIGFSLGFRVPGLYLAKIVRPQRVALFSVQMVDSLVLMANALKSGLNIPQAMQIVVDEMPSPIRDEFGLVLSENKFGLSIEAAFENLAKRIPSEDVSMFVTSVNILRETGGNIAETFETITKTIRERMKLYSKISAMTAQGMSSAMIVGLLPWGLGVMLYLADPQQMTPLFTTIPGWGMLLVMILLEAMGFVVIMKIVKIKV